MSISVYSNIVRDFIIFLLLSNDETVDPDEAAAMRDWLMNRLHEIDAALLQQITDCLAKEDNDLEDSERSVMEDTVRGLQLHSELSTNDQTDINRMHSSRTSRQLARVIADIHLFLELTGEDKLNLDDSVKMMEFMAGSLGELETPFVRALVDAFPEIAPEYGEAGEATVRDIARAYGLEELLAADDPVRLAELEALDDAHEFEERYDPLGDIPSVDWRADVRRPYLPDPERRPPA